MGNIVTEQRHREEVITMKDQAILETGSIDSADEPLVVSWSELGVDAAYSTTDIRNDDTGTWRKDTEDGDT